MTALVLLGALSAAWAAAPEAVSATPPAGWRPALTLHVARRTPVRSATGSLAYGPSRQVHMGAGTDWLQVGGMVALGHHNGCPRAMQEAGMCPGADGRTPVLRTQGDVLMVQTGASARAAVRWGPVRVGGVAEAGATRLPPLGNLAYVFGGCRDGSRPCEDVEEAHVGWKPTATAGGLVGLPVGGTTLTADLVVGGTWMAGIGTFVDAGLGLSGRL